MKSQSAFHFCPHDGQPLQVPAKADHKRPACAVCGFVDYRNPKACVVILIMKKGRLLLGRRAVEPARGLWDIPGGFVDEGESAEQAVRREAREETGLRVRVSEYLGTFPDTYGPRKVPILNLCYLVDIVDGEETPQSDVASLAWFPLAAVPRKMAFAHQRRVIKALKQRLRGRARPG